ncbi:LEAF RUST 10 DISEASE-RESISTANCE LOCUS RECEPTOR-LIKE PROTEIN KINASE-like 2.4 [Prunus avium]|uniref:LEAF RUST 10 DISEASE-RESISTANCE LOCUS RECEPTOR-LIKE PROTEIN KINASE-like 2.4 n=1 Tax=Prunus avium TaxID=42229 RepID=A0A6P5RSE3_PRUAV|nr:LEAF RUST 10 DISEASE-RESISTANCE LOCUS RECEPTOR-LIKE PROTEIN KINASE-like 2.4 [Prunus avium]
MGSGTRPFTLSSWVLVAALFGINLLSSEICSAKYNYSCASSCGNIHNISYPFQLNRDPEHCGDSRHTLHCDNNVTVLHLNSAKYLVLALNYDDTTIRVVDPGLEKNNCSSIPRYPITKSNFSLGDLYSSSSQTVTFIKCANPVSSSLYVATAPCINNLSRTGYVKLGSTASDLEDGCSIEWTTMMSNSLYKENYQNFSYRYIHNALMYGFELNYHGLGFDFVKCGPHQWTPLGNKCKTDYEFFKIKDLASFFRSGPLRLMALITIYFVSHFMVNFIFGAPFVIAFLIYKWRKRHSSMYSRIEDFLHSDNNFLPIRYSYSDIKKMSNKFKNKLGEGGFGTVFKGKLRSGRFGAIKMLGKSKANGEDFISEVATIGRIHHVNVVQLVGYCVEGSKRALVYEFMQNGSLDKYIYSKEGSNLLSYKKMYDISLGVARGIEYLHQGCDMQILHFDIKPRNILLDENFVPKISDFGLAKLYPTDNSIVSLTAARGTMGYMAPELFYKNIGGVSYKADVYSFEKLLMEMGSKRKNLNARAEHSSQIYFPSWVDQYKEGKELEMEDITEEEKKIVKKMVITALWCIQLKPSDRPAMNKVIKMLEGDVESLQMPPKPFLCPQEMPVDIHDNLNHTCSNVEVTCTLSPR